MNSITAHNASGNPFVSFQLNVNLAYSVGGNLRVYWIQDVVQFDTSDDEAYFIDNVWNFSSTIAGMAPHNVYGDGQVASFQGQTFYYDRANTQGIHLALPATLTLVVTWKTSPLDAQNDPTVGFEYGIGSTLAQYDSVTLVSVNRAGPIQGFLVNGFEYNPAGLYYDAEMVMGGAGGGQSVIDLASDVGMSLYYWNGFNYQLTPDTYNFGSDTAESVTNISALTFHRMDTGQVYTELKAGAGVLDQAYESTQLGMIDIVTSVSSGEVLVQNVTYPFGSFADFPFKGGQIRVSVYPGTYQITIYHDGARIDQGNETVNPGQELSLETPLGDIQLTMSYSVQVPSASFVPVLTYVHGGKQLTANLTSTPSVYYMDAGTNWSITGNRSGPSERWVVTEPTSGVASSFLTIRVTYYHQFLVDFSYSIVGGGSGYAPPSVDFSSLGDRTVAGIGSHVWADAGSQVTWTNPLSGSDSTRRWDENNAAISIAGAGTFSEEYYYQFALALTYGVVGGGTPPLPTVAFQGFGEISSVPLGHPTSSVWVDSGGSWNVTRLLGSGGPERWAFANPAGGIMGGPLRENLTYYHQFALVASTNSMAGGTSQGPILNGTQFGVDFATYLGAGPTTSFLDSDTRWSISPTISEGEGARWALTGNSTGLDSSPMTITFVYVHQFYVEVSWMPPTGGIVANTSGWYATGSTVPLSAAANSGWAFGGWNGSGDGQYSGLLNETSAMVAGPLQEVASFSPGITITAGTNGRVTYLFGESQGTVEAGTTMVVYPRAGTSIMLAASPSSVLYAFSGWSSPAVGPAGQTSVTVGTPTTIKATFSPNLLVITLIAATASIALAVPLYAKRRLRRTRSELTKPRSEA